MDNFVVKSESLTTKYEYQNNDVTVSGSFLSDKQKTVIQGIDGQVYAKAEGEARGAYIGNFTGTLDDNNEMEYSLSKMTKSKKNTVWTAIDGIEAYVMPNANAEGGEE